MKTFKRKSMYAAVLAGLGAVGAVGTAGAVNLSGNMGQVLIYPYYTVRAGFDTYLSVVNTTGETKAVKVRFLEGKNSREVLDFNLYLSPKDEWTGAVVATASGAKLITADKSCTVPTIPTGGQEFVNYAFVGATTTEGRLDGFDGEDTSLDRTREGYFEIIEMGVVTNTVYTSYSKHNSAGVPANCAALQTITMNNAADLTTPTGNLAGTASLINVQGGSDYGYDPVAIDNFRGVNTPAIWQAPGDIFPDLTYAFPPVSNIFVSDSVSVLTDTWAANTADAVSAVLMHNNVINEYVLDAATASGTDWVVTFPTKRNYVSADDPTNSSALDPNGTVLKAPFSNKFWTGGACDPVTLSYFDREERAVTSVDFSPRPPSGSALCWEANVVTFNNSDLLGSTNKTNFPVSFENGWANINFSGANAATVGLAGSTHTWFGLPVVGFMAQDFMNGTLVVNGQNVLSVYGGNFSHKTTRNYSGN